MWFYRFKHAFIALLLPWLLAVTTQLAGRVYLLTDYCHPELLASSSVDIRRMFLIGGLFDIRIASLMFVPCLLIAGILALGNNSFKLWQRSWPWLATILGTLITILTVGNIFYYATYQRPIDIFIFGLVEDDTTAVLKTLWSDYPVIRSVICLILVVVAILWICRRWQKKISTWPEQRHCIAVSAISRWLSSQLVLLARAVRWVRSLYDSPMHRFQMSLY